MTGVRDSQTITQGYTGRTGTRCVVEHVVKRVHIMERRWRDRPKTLQKGSIDSQTKPTSTRVEWKHKRRIDETTRTLGAHCKQVVNLQCIDSHALANAYNVSCHTTAAGALDDHRQASGQERVYRHCYSTGTIQHGIKPALTPYAVRQCINPALMIQH